jgi:hypothetical protein
MGGLCNSKGEAASRRGLPTGLSVFIEGGASSPASERELKERVGWRWGLALSFH